MSSAKNIINKLLKIQIDHKITFLTRNITRRIRNTGLSFKSRRNNRFGSHQITFYGTKCFNELSQTDKNKPNETFFMKAVKCQLLLPASIKSFVKFREPFEIWFHESEEIWYQWSHLSGTSLCDQGRPTLFTGKINGSVFARSLYWHTESSILKH